MLLKNEVANRRDIVARGCNRLHFHVLHDDDHCFNNSSPRFLGAVNILENLADMNRFLDLEGDDKLRISDVSGIPSDSEGSGSSSEEELAPLPPGWEEELEKTKDTYSRLLRDSDWVLEKSAKGDAPNSTGVQVYSQKTKTFRRYKAVQEVSVGRPSPSSGRSPSTSSSSWTYHLRSYNILDDGSLY